MDPGLLVQYVAIALAVLASAAYVMRVQWPDATRRLRVACAVPLVRPGRPAWMQAVGRRIAPPALGGKACGECSGCD